MIIAVEGIDCSGKGEVCHRIAESLNAILYKTPPEHMRQEQDLVNATASVDRHYDYFKRVVQIASDEMSSLALSRDVVVDRYWMTTIVYHRAMGVLAELKDMGEIVMPDMTVYLTVSPEVQAARMLGRGMSPGDKRMAGKEHLIRKIYDEVLATQPNVIRVDTSSLTIDQVVSLVLTLIGRRLQT